MLFTSADDLWCFKEVMVFSHSPKSTTFGLNTRVRPLLKGGHDYHPTASLKQSRLLRLRLARGDAVDYHVMMLKKPAMGAPPRD
jgi:hypothetical protein